MRRINNVYWFLIMAMTMCIVFSAINYFAGDPVVEVITDNTASLTVAETDQLWINNPPASRFSDFALLQINNPEQGLEFSSYPLLDDDPYGPFYDPELDLYWDGVKVEGWDEPDTDWPMIPISEDTNDGFFYLAPFVGIDEIPFWEITDYDPNDPGCPDMYE